MALYFEFNSSKDKYLIDSSCDQEKKSQNVGTFIQII